MLRNDDVARRALEEQVEQHLKDKKMELMRRAGGMPKNFLQANVKAAKKGRPRSAPMRLTSPMEVPLEQRPAFRPGGAEFELYERPGPPAYDYQPKRPSRPQNFASVCVT